MNRARTQDTAERIGRALDLVPRKVLDYMGGGLDFFEGDFHFAGYGGEATEYTAWFRDAAGALYSETFRYADSAYYCHRPEVGTPTVVLPQRRTRERGDYPSVKVVLHEIGHHLYHALSGEAFGRSRDRWRYVWDRQYREIAEWKTSGVFPSFSSPFTDYAPESHSEQFAEAFAFWLHPSAHYGRDGSRPAEEFYAPDADHWDLRNERPSNRRLLAFFNELAGWPGDLPPRILR